VLTLWIGLLRMVDRLPSGRDHLQHRRVFCSVSVIYDYDALEQKVASISQNLLLTLTDADISSAAVDPPPSARMALQLTAEASSRYGAVLDKLADGHPFRVTCNGQSLFLGVSYIWYGQAAIETPVFDVALDAENLVTLYFGAWEGAWMTWEMAGADVERQRFDRPELRAAFCQRGALQVLDPDAMPPETHY